MNLCNREKIISLSEIAHTWKCHIIYDFPFCICVFSKAATSNDIPNCTITFYDAINTYLFVQVEKSQKIVPSLAHELLCSGSCFSTRASHVAQSVYGVYIGDTYVVHSPAVKAVNLIRDMAWRPLSFPITRQHCIRYGQATHLIIDWQQKSVFVLAHCRLHPRARIYSIVSR